jgi:hypothetical protein
LKQLVKSKSEHQIGRHILHPNKLQISRMIVNVHVAQLIEVALFFVEARPSAYTRTSSRQAECGNLKGYPRHQKTLLISRTSYPRMGSGALLHGWRLGLRRRVGIGEAPPLGRLCVVEQQSRRSFSSADGAKNTEKPGELYDSLRKCAAASRQSKPYSAGLTSC